MSELIVRIPKDLEREIKDLPENWSAIALEAIRLKAFQLKLEQSAEFRKAFVEAIASKSCLSEEEADKFAVSFGRKIKKGRSEKFKSLGSA